MKSKDHHFVPRHYLRHFRIGVSKQIATVVLEPYRYVGPASIGDQCKQKHFYGEDGALDGVMWQSENDLAPALTRIVEKKRFDSKELVALRMFAVLMNTRTRKASEEAKVFEKHKFYEFIKARIEAGKLRAPEGGWEPGMVDFDGVPGMLLKRTTLPCFLEMQTLNCKLLEAVSGCAFITSDNPVVLLNQYFAHLEPHRSFVGFSRSGFQCLIPLSPTLSAFFYDPKIYKVGGKGLNLVQIAKSDVDLVNALQIQSAERCVYFHDQSLEPYVRTLVSNNLTWRTALPDMLREIKGRVEGETIVHLRSASVKLPQPWAFCRRRRRPNVGPNARRDPAWSDFIDAVTRDMDENPGNGNIFAHMGKLLGQEFR